MLGLCDEPTANSEMQQVKIFKGVDSDTAGMEREINRWMRKSGARVLSITGNIASHATGGSPMSSFAASDILVIVLYEIDRPE